MTNKQKKVENKNPPIPEPGGGDTALHLAAQNGHRAVVECYIQHGVDSNCANAYNGDTPFHLAVYFGHKDVAEYLFGQIADPNSRCIAGTPLHLAVSCGRCPRRGSFECAA